LDLFTTKVIYDKYVFG